MVALHGITITSDNTMSRRLVHMAADNQQVLRVSLIATRGLRQDRLPKAETLLPNAFRRRTLGTADGTPWLAQ